MNYKRSLVASGIKKYDSAYNKVCKCIKNYDCNITPKNEYISDFTLTSFCS